MQPGDLIAERFEILHLSDSGGMGTVYLARDRLENQEVALKVMQPKSGGRDDRFDREARLLAELSHPAIVRYLAHGSTPAGELFLAMEWLQGEDLGERLLRSGLTVQECVSLIRRVATALSAAHAQGIIHRDIKPSNLFLVAGDPTRVKVLDFGIARTEVVTNVMTQTGVIVGTLGFMAPEQVRGDREIDGRLDIFALGCVLFECLTGQRPFTGDHPLAVLAKVLIEEAPRARTLRPDLPEDLDTLLAHMLSKDPDDRPAGGDAVVAALDGMGHQATGAPPTLTGAPEVLTGQEQRFLSVVLVSLEDDRQTGRDPTLTPEQLETNIAPLLHAVTPLGGRLTPVADGAVLVTLQSASPGEDQATRAAACALAIHRAAPKSAVALATGPMEVTGPWPVGPMIDRAAGLLREAMDSDPHHIRIDAATAGLLDLRFEVRSQDGVHLLIGKQDITATARRLLGRPTPCVGRKRELAFLKATVDECIEEPVAQAVLITAPLGYGKTRIGREFVEGVRERSDADVLVARGDPVYAGSAFGLARQLVRHAARLREGTGLDAQHQALREHLQPLFDDPDLTRIAEFLGALVQAPSPQEPSPSLRAALNDPSIMNEQLRAAFVDWMSGLTTRRPLVVVLEDLQWGDLSSASLIEQVLRSDDEQPLLVLGLARPEVTELLPRLWSDLDLEELRLSPLKRRAAERLVRSALGADQPAKTVSRIVEQAGGNAFYLEELIRHVAEGNDSPLPETVLAMAQTRLEGLPAAGRRILRAASVFGVVFWENGVSRLLGDDMRTSDIDGWIDSLIAAEILEPSRESKFTGVRELAFRHSLHREAAYAMLTAADRELGHRLAASWLESVQERDATVLAEHFALGGEPFRAIPYFVRAAHSAFDGANLDATLALAARGIDCGAGGEARGNLRLYEALSRGWSDELDRGSEAADDALWLLTEGDTPWFLALGVLSFTGAFRGDPAILGRAVTALQNYQGDIHPVGPAGQAGFILIISLMQTGQLAPALKVYERLERTVARTEAADLDPVFEGWLRLVRTFLAVYGHAPLGDARPNAQAAVALFEEARAHTARAIGGFLLGWANLVVGDLKAAIHTSRQTIEIAQRRDIRMAEGWAIYPLGAALILAGEVEAGVSTLRTVVDKGNLTLTLYARSAIALATLLSDQLDEADQEAQCVVDQSELLIQTQAQALTVQANVSLRRGDHAKALQLARRAFNLREPSCVNPLYDSLLRQTLVEALHHTGDKEAARDTLRQAQVHLEQQASSLADDAERALFLRHIPANPRLLDLARQWLTP